MSPIDFELGAGSWHRDEVEENVRSALNDLVADDASIAAARCERSARRQLRQTCFDAIVSCD